VALTTLMNERAAIGGGGGGASTTGTNRLVELCRAMGRATDPMVRQKLADVIIRSRVAHYSTVRSMAAVAVGQAPGPELSLAKMALTDAMLRTNELLSLVLGPALVADGGQWGTYAWSHYVLGVPGMRVAGGSDEVLRNIIGERVLGLPKEPRPA
jgi:alkylation response protein AidB-like acyl-CoA dehydrogenase